MTPHDPRLAGFITQVRKQSHVAFALRLWTVPVLTPDQGALASGVTADCLLVPRLKERRFAAPYGKRFERHHTKVPYTLPRQN